MFIINIDGTDFIIKSFSRFQYGKVLPKTKKTLNPVRKNHLINYYIYYII